MTDVLEEALFILVQQKKNLLDVQIEKDICREKKELFANYFF